MHTRIAGDEALLVSRGGSALRLDFSTKKTKEVDLGKPFARFIPYTRVRRSWSILAVANGRVYGADDKAGVIASPLPQ